MSIRGAIRVTVLAVAGGGFFAASTFSIRTAWADYWFQKETAEATAKALALTPDQSAYSVRLAMLVGDEQPAKAGEVLRRAVVLNPGDGRAWIELGLRYEAAGNLAEAETSLLRAADADKTYVPRWTLVNFYFRRNNADRFWQWAKAAVPMIYADPLPLFHLCGRMKEDGALIDRLEIRKPETQARYLYYLLSLGRGDLVGPASQCLLKRNRDEDVPLLLDTCDRLIETQRGDDAREIWRGLTQARRIPSSAEGADASSILTDGDFTAAPTGHGFDWRLAAAPGISAAREENPGGLRLTFNGMQSERTDPLIQFVGVQEQTRYVLKTVYRTSQIGVGSGLAWRISDATGTRALHQAADLSSEQQVEQQQTFVTPAGCRMVRLSLSYERRPGTTRIAGYVILRNVSLSPSVQLPSEEPRSRVMK